MQGAVIVLLFELEFLQLNHPRLEESMAPCAAKTIRWHVASIVEDLLGGELHDAFSSPSHLHAVVLEGDDVSHLTLGGELQAGGYVHIVKHRCECSGEAIGYLRPRGKRGQTKVAQG